MTNEAIKVEGDYEVHDFTVSNSVGIPMMTLCKMSGAGRTASASTADNDIFAGIAATEKEANSGQTNLGLYTSGIFSLTASATIPMGARICLSGANTIRATTSGDLILGRDFGVALESITSGNKGEVKILR